MTVLAFLVGLCVLVVWAISIVDVVRHHYSGATLVGWIALIVILPFIGSVIYWATRKPTRADAEEQYLREEDLRRDRAGRPFDSTGFGP
jgi:hypothetical protein